MSTWQLAILLKPLVNFLFMVLIVLPIEWLLFQIFPNGRLKVILFRKRHGEHATRRDRYVYAVAAVVLYALLIAWVGVLMNLG